MRVWAVASLAWKLVTVVPFTVTNVPCRKHRAANKVETSMSSASKTDERDR
jgi:hypothetical protein